MDRPAFHNLLKRYLEGRCSKEECLIIDKWYELLDDDTVVPLNASEWDGLESRLWDKIQNELIDPKVILRKSYRRKNLYSSLKWLGAAAVFCAVTAGIYLYTSLNKYTGSIESEKVREGLLENINLTAAVKIVTLEDGSKVALQPKSKIAFPVHFSKNRREVYLEGEAFFDVTKNAARPFFVYNNDLIAEVLGTSFDVKIINNKIEVAVKTGRVAVYENGKRINLDAQQKKANGVIVTPNQKVIYYTEDRHFVTSLVDAPSPIVDSGNIRAFEKIKFVFDDTPLSEVLQLMEKVYGVPIILENDNLKTCPFTGDITKPNLFNKLEFICQAFQASYEIKGTKILITGGRGCN